MALQRNNRRDVSEADSCAAANVGLLHQLLGAREQPRQYVDAERLVPIATIAAIGQLRWRVRLGTTTFRSGTITSESPSGLHDDAFGSNPNVA
jgi:hypothetical protein